MQVTNYSFFPRNGASSSLGLDPSSHPTRWNECGENKCTCSYMCIPHAPWSPGKEGRLACFNLMRLLIVSLPPSSTWPQSSEQKWNLMHDLPLGSGFLLVIHSMPFLHYTILRKKNEIGRVMNYCSLLLMSHWTAS